MKKEQLTHTIIYSLLLTACITLAFILYSCSTGEAPEPGFHADKTPLTIGTLTVQAQTSTFSPSMSGRGDAPQRSLHADTRQTAEEFFVEGDELILYAIADDSSYKSATFTYTPGAPGGNPWTLTGEPIYYEDVYKGYGFTIEFGNFYFYDQSEGTHPADYISGYPTLNGPTLTRTDMIRRHTQINFVLEKGDDWGDTDFQQYLNGCKFAIGDYTPYTTFDADGQTLTCSVIIRPSYWKGFTLTTPAGRKQTLTLNETFSPKAGYAYTITAPYHLRGVLGTPTINITPWQKDGESTGLPGYTPEELPRILFLNWADKVRAGNYDLDHTLTADIDLTGITWQPLPHYNGTFDGAGHTITGLTVDSKEQHTGLFTSTDAQATIKNLTLSGADILTTYSANSNGYLAALVGLNWGTIENCRVLDSSITGGIGFTGALAGYNNYGGTILACTATGCTVQGGYITGGITGYNQGTLIACHTSGGTVESTAAKNDYESSAGGIAGEVSSGTITACYAAPTAVTAYGEGSIPASQAGGVVGTGTGTLTANYWKSSITGVTHGRGNNGGHNTNAEPTDGLTPEVIAAMNAAIDAYNANPDNTVPCNYHWTTTGPL